MYWQRFPNLELAWSALFQAYPIIPHYLPYNLRIVREKKIEDCTLPQGLERVLCAREQIKKGTGLFPPDDKLRILEKRGLAKLDRIGIVWEMLTTGEYIVYLFRLLDFGENDYDFRLPNEGEWTRVTECGTEDEVRATISYILSASG